MACHQTHSSAAICLTTHLLLLLLPLLLTFASLQVVVAACLQMQRPGSTLLTQPLLATVPRHLAAALHCTATL
jgi:hypothetical protein